MGSLKDSEDSIKSSEFNNSIKFKVIQVLCNKNQCILFCQIVSPIWCPHVSLTAKDRQDLDFDGYSIIQKHKKSELWCLDLQLSCRLGQELCWIFSLTFELGIKSQVRETQSYGKLRFRFILVVSYGLSQGFIICFRLEPCQLKEGGLTFGYEVVEFCVAEEGNSLSLKGHDSRDRRRMPRKEHGSRGRDMMAAERGSVCHCRTKR